jgi:hypothetical protein
MWQRRTEIMAKQDMRVGKMKRPFKATIKVYWVDISAWIHQYFFHPIFPTSSEVINCALCFSNAVTKKYELKGNRCYKRYFCLKCGRKSYYVEQKLKHEPRALWSRDHIKFDISDEKMK